MPSSISQALRAFVRRRAADLCEYCQVGTAAYRSTFPIDHIRARQHGGSSTADNLALACLQCNLHKGPNITGVDPVGGTVELLFDPRLQRWAEHFRWDGPALRGVTQVGRATVEVLQVNLPDFVRVRRSLIDQGGFPPADVSP